MSGWVFDKDWNKLTSVCSCSALLLCCNITRAQVAAVGQARWFLLRKEQVYHGTAV
jgi:hypothetical protein